MRGQSIVQAKVFGEYDGREYEFMVDTGFSFLVLPQEEIEALGLRRARGTVKLVSATGLVDVATYHTDGELMGQECGATLGACAYAPAGL